MNPQEVMDAAKEDEELNGCYIGFIPYPSAAFQIVPVRLLKPAPERYGNLAAIELADTTFYLLPYDFPLIIGMREEYMCDRVESILRSPENIFLPGQSQLDIL